MRKIESLICWKLDRMLKIALIRKRAHNDSVKRQKSDYNFAASIWYNLLTGGHARALN